VDIEGATITCRQQHPPADYLDPTAFFAKRYPTRGMKELLKGKMARRTRGVK